MSQSTLVMLSALLGAVFTAAIFGLFIAISRYSVRTSELFGSLLPKGVKDAIDALPVAAISVDASYTIVESNAAANQMEMVTDQTITNSDLIAVLDSVTQTRQSHHAEITITHRRGSDTYLEVIARPLTGPFILMLLLDRTEQNLIEQMRRDFTANVSHELKTPIAAAQLLSEAIGQATDDPARVAKFNSSLAQEITRLGTMVNDIIQLSSIESESNRARFHPVVVSDIVESVLDRSRNLASERDVTCTSKVDKNLAIFGRRRLLDNIVSALVENAILYSKPGSQVGVSVEGDNHGYVVITVSDHGVGIPLEGQARIFERFYRVDAAHSPNTSGTGLGLSIVKNAVKVLGGDISLWSRTGVGTSFTVKLRQFERTPSLK